MTTKRKASPAKAADPEALRMKHIPGLSGAGEIATVALDSVVGNAVTSRMFVKGTFSNTDLTECVDALTRKGENVMGGDLSALEATLTAQATTLDTIFNQLAQRSAHNLGTHLEATERYMRLALKAQGQCRATMETLAAIKSPPTAFLKQANIAHGPQQVNNGMGSTHTKKAKSQKSKLLEDQQVNTLDSRTARKSGGANPHLEAVDAVYRSA